MYFSMIRLRKDISLRHMAMLTKGDGYRIHKVVWDLFADHSDRKRDFIYRHNPVNSQPTFYAVSQRKPVDTSGTWDIAFKEYHPNLQPGQRLCFSLIANPIRSKRDETRRQHRHDVIMDAKLELKQKGENINLPIVVQEHGSRWLLDRADTYGFSISTHGVRADGYRQHRLIKGKNNQIIKYSTIDLNGILTVVNPDLFVKECLFCGIGPAKAFGCGLMLVRRI